MHSDLTSVRLPRNNQRSQPIKRRPRTIRWTFAPGEFSFPDRQEKEEKGQTMPGRHHAVMKVDAPPDTDDIELKRGSRQLLPIPPQKKVYWGWKKGKKNLERRAVMVGVDANAKSKGERERL